MGGRGGGLAGKQGWHGRKACHGAFGEERDRHLAANSLTNAPSHTAVPLDSCAIARHGPPPCLAAPIHLQDPSRGSLCQILTCNPLPCPPPRTPMQRVSQWPWWKLRAELFARHHPCQCQGCGGTVAGEAPAPAAQAPALLPCEECGSAYHPGCLAAGQLGRVAGVQSRRAGRRLRIQRAAAYLYAIVVGGWGGGWRVGYGVGGRCGWVGGGWGGVGGWGGAFSALAHNSAYCCSNAHSRRLTPIPAASPELPGSSGMPGVHHACACALGRPQAGSVSTAGAACLHALQPCTPTVRQYAGTKSTDHPNTLPARGSACPL